MGIRFVRLGARPLFYERRPALDVYCAAVANAPALFAPRERLAHLFQLDAA
jgi:hypothetical protein